MSIKLHGAALSPFVRKARVALAEKGLAFESIHVDPFSSPEEYSALNPLRRIPAMEDGDKVLADSGVICAYLEKAYPDPPLYPTDAYDYARALWLEKYADYEVAPQATFGVFRNRIVMKLAGKPCDEDKVQKALTEKLPPLFDYLETQIQGRDWFAGDAFSIADIAVATQCVNLQHGGEQVDPARWPALAAHIAKVHQRPSFAKLIERESQFVAKVRGE
ncbi:transferase [Alcanivorax sp. S71-1-4]|jgi:glutathione S-transferase|uniref:glutathione S-transferase family protein n=1 Tax=Alcanivorax sp. S71-1-4 TaxID=1177159 RepID=UPI001356A856|nr:glutathione S-transferase family protein [Alcanivorax sp. S71-1-4]KAF0810188.1 transferase [Alcanivorax sp. S71-1-4]